ncbi:TPA: hypothetical protein ACVU0F_002711, partial [Yersinia enterocolitica]
AHCAKQDSYANSRNRDQITCHSSSPSLISVRQLPHCANRTPYEPLPVNNITLCQQRPLLALSNQAELLSGPL